MCRKLNQQVETSNLHHSKCSLITLNISNYKKKMLRFYKEQLWSCWRIKSRQRQLQSSYLHIQIWKMMKFWTSQLNYFLLRLTVLHSWPCSSLRFNIRKCVSWCWFMHLMQLIFKWRLLVRQLHLQLKNLIKSYSLRF